MTTLIQVLDLLIAIFEEAKLGYFSSQNVLTHHDNVLRLAQEANVSYAYADKFLREYERLRQKYLMKQQLRPMQIDPRGIPALGGPIAAQRNMFKLALTIALPVHMAIAEFAVRDAGYTVGIFTGKDALTGHKLGVTERAIGGALLLLSFVPATKYIGAARKLAFGAGRVAEKSLTIGAQNIAKYSFRFRAAPIHGLRLAGRLSRIPKTKFQQLYKKLRRAKQSKSSVILTDAERALIREVDNAFVEFTHGGAQVIAVRSPKALRFIFKSASQPIVLGRLLGRTLDKTIGKRMRRSGFQSAEDTSAAIVSAIRRHWDEALNQTGQTAEQAARTVFDVMRRKNPANPNTWIRERFFALWRIRALRRIYNDRRLRRQLADEAGIILGKNPKSENISIHIITELVSGKRVQTPVDFDHAKIGHAKAVNQAIRTGDPRHLVSTVRSNNLQLLTARENRNFIEALRKANGRF